MASIDDTDGSAGISRRNVVKGAAVAAGGSLIAGGAAASAPIAAEAAGPVYKGSSKRGSADLALINGRILTLNEKNTVASAISITDGRIAEVGRNVGRAARTIDLRGATVIPGLIDCSTRYTRTAAEPGYHVREIETARSIADILRMISARAKTVPKGAFITGISGWGHNGLAENRLPTPAELDKAAPKNPVFLAENYFGDPSLGVANTKGIAFFQSKGVAIDTSTGRLDLLAGIAALQAVQTDAEKLRSTAEGMAFAASLGITMINDFGDSGKVNPDDPEAVDSLESAFQHVVDLWRRENLKVRLRLRVPRGKAGYQARIINNINRLGDDILRLNGMSDVTGGDIGFPPPVAETIPPLTYVAAHGWSLSTQALSKQENEVYAAGIKAANAAHPVKDLRWSLAHVNEITAAVAQDMAAIGVGVTPSGWQFPYDKTAGAFVAFGPPWRTLLDTPGLRVGAGTDAVHSGPFNPWLNIYYMTTGRNNAGEVVNGSQTISRTEALKIYTKGSAWHTFDEHHLGTLERGKLADLAVLSANPLKVSDDQLRTMTSKLTLQAGKIVHKSGR